MEKIETAAHYKEVVDQIKYIDDLLRDIELIDKRMNHLSTAASDCAATAAIERSLAGSVELVAGTAKDMLTDVVGDILYRREQLDEAARDWESFECYGDLDRKYAGSCVA